MSSSLRPDLSTRIHPEPYNPLSLYSIPDSDTPIDHFDRLPDSILLLIFNKIADVKALGRCGVVSRRFHTLVPQVDNVLVRVDCVISDDDPSSPSSSSSSSSSGSDKSRSPFSHLFRLVFDGVLKPLQALSSFLGPKRTNHPHHHPHPHPNPTLFLDNNHNNNSYSAENNSSSNSNSSSYDDSGVTHHSPTQVLKNFNEIRVLKIELPSGELGIDDGVLLKWRADFGSTLDNCVILGASSVIYSPSPPTPTKPFALIDSNADVANANANLIVGPGADDNGSIPESFYTNGGLKLRVVWTISSLIAASARHYLLQPIIAEHKTLDSLVLTDADGQGVLNMNRDQLEELRVKPLSASSASKRTLVPALNMRLWYAPHLELPDGTVLKGATLVAIRPSEQQQQSVVKVKEVAETGTDGSWVSAAFEEPFGTAARMLVKRRTYCLEMNSF